jgi:transmembrane sensor
MIEPREEMAASATKVVARRAADWIQRRHFWDWSQADQAELDAWLAEAPIHLVTFLRLEAAWKRTERLAALNRPLSELPRNTKPNAGEPFLLRAAVAIVIGCLCVAGLWLVSQPKDNTFATPIGVHETISLADGSQIELNTNSVLRTRADPKRRLVILDSGEAFFSVKHDAAHPFVVIAGDHRIVDLGTKFAVRETAKGISVTVVEGSARLESSGARSAVLVAGDKAVASARSLVVTKEPRHEIASALAWQRGMLVFSQTPLVEVADELNRYNTKKLVIADAQAGKARIGGTFPTDGIEEVTAAARVLFGLRVEDRGTEIVISR